MNEVPNRTNTSVITKQLMIKIFIIICTALFWLSSQGQNGRIIEQKELNIIADSIFKEKDPYRKHYLPILKNLMDRVEFYHITYLSDGLKINGYLDIPKKPGNYPCIIYNHGGGFEWGNLSFWDYLFSMANTSKSGYVVIASEYRGIGGSEGLEEFGGNDIHDVLNLIPVLSQLTMADTSRIGMYGISRGGMMTYRCLTKTNAIKAAIVVSGWDGGSDVTADRPDMDSIFSARLPEYKADKNTFYQKRSAIEHAADLCKTTPIFIIQGTADWRVKTPSILKLVNKLYEVKQPFRFSLFEGGTHGVLEFDEEVERQIKLFFDTYVRDRRKIPSVELHGE